MIDLNSRFNGISEHGDMIHDCAICLHLKLGIEISEPINMSYSLLLLPTQSHVEG